MVRQANEDSFFGETIRVCWVAALLAEAKPLISQFELIPELEQTFFPIYKNEKLGQLLIVSGTGQSNATAAVAYLAGKYNIPPWVAWINIGLAGFPEPPVGKLFQAIKVTNSANTRVTFPGVRFSKLVSPAQLETLETPSSNYKPATLYDMEGAAFSEIASRFSCNELTFLFKIVSDTCESELSQITSLLAEELIRDNLTSIKLLFNEINELVSLEKKRLQLPKEVATILTEYHFSASRRVQLIRKYRKWRAVFPDSSLKDFFRGAVTAGDIISRLDGSLSSISFDWRSE